MRPSIIAAILIFGIISYGYPNQADTLQPSPIRDIVGVLENVVIPELEIEGFPLGESLKFIHSKYTDIEIDPPRDQTFVIELRLPDSILKKSITVKASSITMIDAIDKVFGDISYALTLEPGKLIFATSPNPKAVSETQNKSE